MTALLYSLIFPHSSFLAFFATKTLNSNTNCNGSAVTNIVKMSVLGVIIAAMTSTARNAWRRYVFKNLCVTMPSRARKNVTTGNSNAIPVDMQRVIKVSM